jgi:hypothetical protein
VPLDVPVVLEPTMSILYHRLIFTGCWPYQRTGGEVLLVHPLLAHYSPSRLVGQSHFRLALQWEAMGLPPSTRVSEYLRDAAYMADCAAWKNPGKQHSSCSGEIGTGKHRGGIVSPIFSSLCSRTRTRALPDEPGSRQRHTDHDYDQGARRTHRRHRPPRPHERRQRPSQHASKR